MRSVHFMLSETINIGCKNVERVTIHNWKITINSIHKNMGVGLLRYFMWNGKFSLSVIVLDEIFNMICFVRQSIKKRNDIVAFMGFTRHLENRKGIRIDKLSDYRWWAPISPHRHFLLKRKSCNFLSGFIFTIMEILLPIVNT